MHSLWLIAGCILHIVCSAALKSPGGMVRSKCYDTLEDLLSSVSAPLIIYSADNTDCGFLAFRAGPLGPVFAFQSSSEEHHQMVKGFTSYPLIRLFLVLMTGPSGEASWRVAHQFDSALGSVANDHPSKKAMAILSGFGERARIRKLGKSSVQKVEFQNGKAGCFGTQLTGRALLQKRIAYRITSQSMGRPVRSSACPSARLVEALLLVMQEQHSVHPLAFVCTSFYNATRPRAIMRMNRLSYERRFLLLLVSFSRIGGLRFFVYKLLNRPRYLRLRDVDRFRLLASGLRSPKPEIRDAMAGVLSSCKDAAMVVPFIEHLMEEEEGRQTAIQAAALLPTSSYRFKEIHALLYRLFFSHEELRLLLSSIQKYATIIYHGNSISEDVLFGLPPELFAAVHERIVALSSS